MKKFVFIAAAALALAACTKTDLIGPQNVISFQPANQLTKVTGSVFPTDQTFGTYAWTEGTTGEYFIENKEVSFANGVWSTATAYFWPKNQSVDFFSYYPYNVAGTVPTVTKTQLTYSNIDFANTQVDIMYADKAVGYTDNADQVQNGQENGQQNGFTGVPTIFRHAGAKVKVNVILGENEKTEAATGVVTKWDVTLKSTQLSGIYTKGNCVLNLADTPTTGLVPWVKPTQNVGTDTEPNYVNVWTPDVNLTNSESNSLYNDKQEKDLVKNEGVTVIGKALGNDQYDGVYMLPQVLAAGQQKIYFTFKVVTYRKAPGETDFVEVLTQNNVVLSADLLIDTADQNQILAWQMNQSIVYNITIGPAGKQITFDPAIIDWEPKTYSTNIDLEI